jgi:mono/diheme cytochrome c family protein
MSKSTWRGWGLGAALAASVLVGAATLGMTSAANATANGAPAPAARGAQTPPAPTDAGDQVAVGRRVFQRTCNRCHPGGGTQRDTGPVLANQPRTEARMRQQIREGAGTMRAISTTRLPDSDMPALLAYLRSIHAVN